MTTRRFFARFFSASFLLGVGAGVLLAAGVVRLAPQAVAGLLGSAVFPDVRSGTFYDEAVGEMVGVGVIKGYDDGTFHPNDFVTRGQMAVLFKRLRDNISGVTPSTPESSSSSVASSVSSVASSSSSRSSSSSSSSSRSAAAATSTNGAFKLAASTFNIPDVAPMLSLSVLRAGGTKGAVSVMYDISGGTAVASTDYTPARGTLTFADGESVKNVSARLIRNPAATSSRTINLTLSAPTGGAVLGDPAQAVVTLTKGLTSGSSSSSSVGAASAAGGVFAFTAAGYGVMENAGTATITVSRTGTTGAAATVEFSTANGSASAGTHYESNGGTLSFVAGETSKTFAIRALNNSSPDGNTQLILQLKNPGGQAALGTPSTVALTIVDDESAPTGSGTVKLEKPSDTVKDTDGYAYVAIVRAGAVNGTASVNYETMDSTARNNADYTRVTGTVTFAPGEMKKLVTIPLLAHAGDDGEKQFTFRISGVTGNSILGSLVEMTVIIQG